MITTKEQKSPDLIAKLQKFESEPEVLKGIFDNSDLDQIRKIQVEAYGDKERCAEKLIQTNKTDEPLGKMAHPNEDLKDQLEKIIRPKLEGVLIENFEMDFSFHRNFFPYGIHTDSGYDSEELIYKQGIIPLEVFPKDGEVYTVVFDQKCYHSISYPRDMETIESLTTEELGQIQEFDRTKNSSEDFASYWEAGEHGHKNFKGLSLALPFRWKLGDMAIWDRAHLHCSSDFSVHNIEGKLGLMWISRRL